MEKLHSLPSGVLPLVLRAGCEQEEVTHLVCNVNALVFIAYMVRKTVPTGPPLSVVMYIRCFGNPIFRCSCTLYFSLVVGGGASLLYKESFSLFAFIELAF